MKSKKTFILKELLKIMIECLYKGAILFFLLLCLWIIIQVSAITTFKVPTDSMTPIIHPGNNILVSKLSVGGRIFNLRKAFKNEPVRIFRLPHYGKVNRNDLIVFNFPYHEHSHKISMNMDRYYIKRCRGIPGDTIEIRNGLYYINNIQDPLSKKMSSNYKSFNHFLNDRYEKVHEKSLYLTYPYDPEINWTIQDFGPLFIPQKDFSIILNKETYILYKTIIEWEQNKELLCCDNFFLLGKDTISNYTFEKNYYFMSGDNFKNSEDSRYWGVLPEDFIVGKAIYIY